MHAQSHGLDGGMPSRAQAPESLMCFVLCSRILRKSDSAELPARRRWEEVAIGRADMIARRDARPTTQDHLPYHELAVVFRDRAFQGAVTGIGIVGRACPFPGVAEQLQIGSASCSSRLISPILEEVSLDRQAAGGALPFELGGKPLACP